MSNRADFNDIEALLIRLMGHGSGEGAQMIGFSPDGGVTKSNMHDEILRTKNGITKMSNAHVFADLSSRDTYFSQHEDELESGLVIQITGSGFQTWNGQSWVNETGLIKGDKGDKGNPGIQGAQGIQGIQGMQGTKGDKGDKGDRGDKGDAGSAGAVDYSSVYTKSEINNLLAGYTPGSGGAVVASEDPYVRITITGATFSPIVELVSGSTATVTWETEETGTLFTGLNPTMNFYVASTRHIRMRAIKDGANALGDIVTFNMGFNNGEDSSGRTAYTVPSSYNTTVRQQISALEGVNNMTGLVRFLAACPGLSCPLDFTGMSQLQFIECYGAGVTAVKLTGCSSLLRLCMEGDNITTFDLNPVSATLRDLRGSGNGDGHAVVFMPLTDGKRMEHLFHWCTQSETLIGHATGDQLPVIEEWWDWSSGETGTFAPRSTALYSVLSSGNQWSSADLTNQFLDHDGNLDLSNNILTSVVLTGCQGLHNIHLQNNQLNQGAVDSILTTVNSWGTSGGTLDLSGNGAPSDATIVSALGARGWNVSTATIVVTTPTAPSLSSAYSTTSVNIATSVSIPYTIDDPNGGAMTATYILDGVTTTANNLSVGSNTWTVGTLTEGDHTLSIQVTDSTSRASNILTFSITASATAPVGGATLWKDDFERADCIGIANVGNGWTSADEYELRIVSGDLVKGIDGVNHGYGLATNIAGGSLPADYTVSMTIPAGNNRGSFWGLVGRWYNGQGGVKIFWQGNITDAHLSNAAGWDDSAGSGGSAVTLTYPANWADNNIQHTVAMRMVGTTITIILDGQEAGTFTYTLNATQTGTSVGLCGEGQGRHTASIEVTA